MSDTADTFVQVALPSIQTCQVPPPAWPVIAMAGTVPEFASWNELPSISETRVHTGFAWLCGTIGSVGLTASSVGRALPYFWKFTYVAPLAMKSTSTFCAPTVTIPRSVVPAAPPIVCTVYDPAGTRTE